MEICLRRDQSGRPRGPSLSWWQARLKEELISSCWFDLGVGAPPSALMWNVLARGGRGSVSGRRKGPHTMCKARAHDWPLSAPEATCAANKHRPLQVNYFPHYLTKGTASTVTSTEEKGVTYGTYFTAVHLLLAGKPGRRVSFLEGQVLFL